MRISRRLTVTLAIAAAGALSIVGVALAGVASNGDNADVTFKFSPSKLPKQKFKAGRLDTDLTTQYANPGNGNPGGAVERTQIYLDDDFKINPNAAAKCDPATISGNIPMSQAMAACGNALVGTGIANATANGAFQINGCVLLFNGTPDPSSGRPRLDVFTRVQVSNPSSISCASPASNNQGNATVLLVGVLRKASGDYGNVLDVDHIQAAAAFPLTEFNTSIKHGNYIAGRCHDSNKKLDVKVTWTYNDGVKETEHKSEACKVA